MTGGFETLIYTDCRPGQGLQGSPGLQFQARSPGAEQQAMTLVQAGLLYEAPSGWTGERRPVEAYPPSLAHTCDGYYATAAGVYLGQEANGAREGNQLTHAVVTTDPDAYGPVRPAQLLGAPFWTRQPSPTTHCDPLPDDWEPGPIDALRAQELVRTTTGGQDLLTVLLSTLQRLSEPDGSRVLFVSDDPATVLGWITAGTLLLPQRQALAISFKVYTTRPSYAVQQVLAVHPEWNRQHATVDNNQGYVVIDLTRNEWSTVEPTASAPLWADLFCTCDPYDVVDAVEVAATSGLPDDQVVPVVAAALLGRPPTADQVMPVVRWLRDGSPEQLELYGGVVADLLTEDATRWPADALTVLDQVAVAGHLADPASAIWAPDRVASVRRALFAAELDQAADRGVVGSGQLPRLPEQVWTDRRRQEAQQRLTAMLATAAPPAFEAGLRVARRFDLVAPVEAVAQAAHTFVRDWADHPEHGYEPARWADGGLLMDLCRDELRHRAIGSPQRAQAVADAWWQVLEPELETVETELDKAVLSAAVLHLPAPRRHDLVRQFLKGVRPLGGSAVRRLTEVLFARTAPDLDELELLASEVPARTPLPAPVFRSLRTALLDADQLPARELTVCQRLVERGLLVPDPRLAELIDAVGSLPTLIRDISGTGRRSKSLPARLSALPRSVVRTYPEELLAALLDSREPAAVVELLPTLPELVPTYLDRLREQTRKPGAVWHAVTAFLVGSDPRALPKLASRHRSELTRATQRWLVRANDRQVAAATDLVRNLGRRELTTRWEEQVVSVKEQGWLNRLWHRSR